MTLGDLIDDFIFLINDYLVPVIFALAFIVFLWGIVQYFIIGATNEESQKKGRQLIIYGIIGFVVMLSVWGIISMFQATLGFDSNTRPSLPTFGSGSSSSDSTKSFSSFGTDSSQKQDLNGSTKSLSN